MAVNMAVFLLAPVYLTAGLLLVVVVGRGLSLIWYNHKLRKYHGGIHAPRMPSGPIIPIRGDDPLMSS